MRVGSYIFFLGLFVVLALPCLAQTQELSETEILADREFEVAFRVRSETIVAVKTVPWETSKEKYRTAIAGFARARDLYRRAGSRRKEADSVWRMAELQKLVDERDEARKNLDEAIRIYTEIGEKLEAGKRKISIGDLYSDAGDYYTAIKFYNEALTAAREAKDPALEAESLTMIGVCYSELFNRPEAIRYWEQSVKVSEASGGDVYTLVATLEMIAKGYAAAAERQKAFEYYSRAFNTLRRHTEKLAREGSGESANYAEKMKLSDLTETVAVLLAELGDLRGAITLYDVGVKGDRSFGFKQREAEKLVGLGQIYGRLGDSKQALRHLEQSLSLFGELKSPTHQAAVMIHISQAHLRDPGSVSKALEFAERALKIAETAGDIALQGLALRRLADVVAEMPDRAKDEIGYREKALELYRSLDDTATRTRLIEELGIAHYRAKNYDLSARYLNEALIIYSVFGMVTDLNGPLYWLQQTWRAAGNHRLATAFGKQGIRTLQDQRKLIANVDVESQRTYLRSIERIYRSYVTFLFEQGRLREAHQALTAFKDQQSFDLASTPEQKHSVRLTMTPREARFWREYVALAEEIVAAKRARENERRLAAGRQPTPEDVRKIKAADDVLTSTWKKFFDFANSAPAGFAQPQDTDDRPPSIAENDTIWRAIKDVSAETQQETVAIYQLVSNDKIDSLIVTADDMKHVSVNAADTNAKARTFWALLQSDRYDPRPLGKALYDIVFKPIEKELPAGTKTILWSLDGNLRYVPMATLFDGKEYLAERFNHVTFTRTDGERLTRPSSSNWTAHAFGSSQRHIVEVGGTRTSFSALPGVGEELGSIFGKTRPVVSGEILLDGAFTRESLLARLKTKRPVVHLASHFSFRPGDDTRSFLLMGDGSAFTLAEIKKNARMFEGVELLTLSACNTAVQQADANGREVDAFFELAQRLGAQSVLATLWPVADNSTPWLMREFYDLKINRKQNKAEALRNAQLSLLNGTATPKRGPVRTSAPGVEIVVGDDKAVRQDSRSERFVVAKKDAPRFVKDPRRPFAHPYYWAPFVLIGNWR